VSGQDPDWWFPFACLAAAILCGVFWVWGKLYLRKQQKLIDEGIELETRKRRDFQERARAYEAEHLQGWPHRLTKSAEFHRQLLMINEERTALRFVQLASHTGLLSADYSVSLREVISAELQQNSETVMQVETTATVQQQGAARRAAVGALIAGPTGAIIGAASKRTSASATSVSTSHTVQGPIYLVVGTSNFERPVIKFEVSSLRQGEEWLHRIRAAILASGPEDRLP